jgi:RNA polymerase sigma-70 factor, ECF subfamily
MRPTCAYISPLRTGMNDQVSLFNQQRSHLYGIAYRMLGSKTDAEDMVQEAYIRWHRTPVERVQSANAWLVTTITRLCIDRLRAAKTEREAYIGPWLPDPLVGNEVPPADAHTELASDLSVAFLVVLERLAPEERAAFLLHEVFDTEYSEVAQILGKNEAACRQIVHRARKRVRRERPRFKVSEDARVRLLKRFLDALQAQDKESLLTLFEADATWTSDGGGKVKAALKVLRGSELVVRFISGIWRRYLSRMTHRFVKINGETGIIGLVDERPFWVLTIDTDGVHILAAFATVNPDKLKSFSPKKSPALSHSPPLIRLGN